MEVAIAKEKLKFSYFHKYLASTEIKYKYSVTYQFH